MFRKYEKIKCVKNGNLDLEKYSGKEIIVTEKIDGANASIHIDENGQATCYSRNIELHTGETLRGFYQFVQELIKRSSLTTLRNITIYGEWLVPHKINYIEQAYKNFYVFAVYSESTNSYIQWSEVESVAKFLGLPLCPVFYNGRFTSNKVNEQVLNFVGKSMLGNEGEGVVIHCHELQDKNKIVTQSFAEVKYKKIKVPSNDIISEFVDQTLTEARIDKLLQKTIDNGIVDELKLEHMGKLLKYVLPNLSSDILNEEDMLIKAVKKEVQKKIGKKAPSVIRKIVADYELSN